ncbi:hypothetical protein JTB14_028720 [Gonioctena quinquepunctata]|nr:hypothetical protein JTB14_028720 [Gonioctena quinquepunctata]
MRYFYADIRTQVICSAELKIIDSVAHWPGSAHDSNIFENSVLQIKLLNGGMRNGVLVSDQRYRLQSYLGAIENEAEWLYNEAQIRTRNVFLEYGKFPILYFSIRCNMELTQMIIAVGAVLHNIAIDEKEENFENGQEFDEEEDKICLETDVRI